MEDVRVIVTKSNQALQTLERYKSRLNQVSTSLSALEFENAVTLNDVLRCCSDQRWFCALPGR